jgi:hypothetical protein
LTRTKKRRGTRNKRRNERRGTRNKSKGIFNEEK